MISDSFAASPALVDDGDAALLAERRIGQDDFVFLPCLAASASSNLDGHLVRAVRADAVQQQVHAAEPRDAVDQLDAVKRVRLQSLLLLPVELVAAWDRTSSCTPRAGNRPCRRRIADRHLRLGPHHIDHRRDQRARREVLSRAAFHVLGVLFQQAFVSVALHIGGQRGPLFLVDQIDDQPPQLGRVLNLVLRLAEDDAEHARSLCRASPAYGDNEFPARRRPWRASWPSRSLWEWATVC